MTWNEVCADRSLHALPYKIELNQWNKIEMSPAGVRRREYQQEIARLLQESRPDGLAIVEPAIRTAENIKVPDVVWALSLKGWNEVARLIPDSIDPDICVELITSRNVREEKLHKGQLYFRAGALEFWLCDEFGYLRFFNAAGPLERSALCPGFPLRVAIPDGPAA